MIWILSIVILLLLLLCWMLVSPLILELDTSSASVRFTWPGIGKASVWYDGGWWLILRVFFFRKKMKLSGLPLKKEIAAPGAMKKKKPSGKIPFAKMIRCIKTFRVEEWRLAVDTGDYPLNAQLYPLNFMPGLQGHLHVNYIEENSLYMKIRNYPWKILYAFIR